MPALRFITIFLCAASAFAETPPTYQSQIDALADRLAHEVQTTPRKSTAPQKLFVASFVNSDKHSSILGRQLADALSAALETRLGTSAQLSRKQFQDRMDALGITAPEVANNRVVAWQAAQAGANLLLLGNISTPNRPLPLLLVSLFELPDNRELSIGSAELTLTSDKLSLINTADITPPPSGSVPVGSRAGDEGVTDPRCQSCPTPDYPEAARQAKFHSVVLLKVTIDAQGQVSSILVLAGAPFGLDRQAVKAVSKWRFVPAIKAGKPIPASIEVDVAFRLSDEPVFPRYTDPFP
jgi:TonB family protein